MIAICHWGMGQHSGADIWTCHFDTLLQLLFLKTFFVHFFLHAYIQQKDEKETGN